MRAGIALGRARWARALDATAAGFVGAEHLRDFDEAGAPPAAGEMRAGSIIANSRCVVPLGWSAQRCRRVDVRWRDRRRAHRGRRCRPARWATATRALESLRGAGTRVVDIPGRWIRAVWELVTQLATQLREDIDAVGPHLDVRACLRVRS